MSIPNMFPGRSLYRRIISYLGIFIIILYISVETYRYYHENYSNPSDSSSLIQYATPYNEYIDQKGRYLPYPGYKILQFVQKPIPSEFTELITFLNQQNELKLYFKLVPEHTYHITLTNLKNKTFYEENQIQILEHEQKLLDQDDIASTCTTKKLLLIDKNELRMEIEMQNIDQLKKYQKRWNETFPNLILQHYTSFYITLAYQYQDIPTKQIFDQLEQVLKDYAFQFNIPLDPIEICSYSNLITYSPIINDVIVHQA